MVRQFVNTQDYWPAYFSLIEKVKLAFDESGVTIPFPQTDLHLNQVESKPLFGNDNSAGSHVKSVNSKMR